MSSNEETRKIQFTGKSTYIVSLPKKWVIDLGLKQGDQVSVERQGISGLRIIPYSTRRKDESDVATIEIDEYDEKSSVVRKLVALYFLRFKTINIKPKTGRITPSQRIGIRDAVKKMLMGSEITADSSDGITIQVLINLVELSVDGAFKRMMLLAKSMQDDALLAIKEGNEDLAKEVINSDDDVDRFGFYITRQLAIAIENEHMLKEMGFENSRDCLGYRVIIKNIERLADHSVRISRDVLDYKTPIKGKIFDRIREMSDFAISVIDDACLALFKKDYDQAEIAIKKSIDIQKYEKRVSDNLKTNKNEMEKYRIRRIIENVRRIAEYASDIGEIVLNMNIEKIIKEPKT
jgi:phosphate uptake regulator